MRHELGGFSPRQLRFVHAFVANGGIVGEALAEAGYPASAPNPMRYPHVRDRVRDLFRKYSRQKGVEARAIIAELASVAFAPIGDPDISTRDKIRALELLGKNQALFTEKIELTGKVKWEHEVDLKQLSDDELRGLEAVMAKVRVVEPERLSEQNPTES